MRRLAISLAVCLAASVYGANPRVVQGKKVSPGPAFTTTPAVTVTGLRFYDCCLAETGTPCTVVSGYLISHLSTPNHKITVTITLYGIDTTWPGDSIDGTGTVEILHPAPGKRVKFVMLAPACHKADHDGTKKYAGHTVSVTVVRHNPRDGLGLKHP